jgi:hypothetical protein
MSRSPSSPFASRVPLDALAALAANLDAAVKASPAADLEKNLKAQLVGELARRGLVTRDEFERQAALLEKARAQLVTLEARLAELEVIAGRSNPPG